MEKRGHRGNTLKPAAAVQGRNVTFGTVASRFEWLALRVAGGRSVDRLIGRRDEMASLERLLDQLDRGHGGAVALVGEPGIGKTRLLAELRTRSQARGHAVLSGVASELERDVPFSVFVDALDDHLTRLDPGGLRMLDDGVLAELAQVFPATRGLSRTPPPAAQHERHRSHRSIRALIEHLGRSIPLVLILDDLHWVDPASTELIDLLVRRPPGSVLLALALRAPNAASRLLAVIGRGQRTGSLVPLELSTLTPGEARQLVGESLPLSVVQRLYGETDGNPFYLEQLARSLDRSATATAATPRSTLTDIGVPSSVAVALAEELDALSSLARRVFDGASVAGDPFDLDLAAAAAEMTERETIDGVDELVRTDLLRPTAAARRFRFRHPLVRRAAYETTPAAWRVGAHQRCADALALRRAPASARAPHIERSARYGDLAAVGVLAEAGHAAARLAPESAARWYDAALGLLPMDTPVERRVELMLARAGALAASGDLDTGHEVLVEASRIVPRSSRLFARVVTACARDERFIGRYERAHLRLSKAIRALPEGASIGSVSLLIELTLNEFYRSRYAEMGHWAGRAVEAAAKIDDPVLFAAALAMPALADAMTGHSERARTRRDEAARIVDGLTDDDLARRIDAATWLSATELYLDMYPQAEVHATRALDVSRATGSGDPAGLYQILPRVWHMQGRLAEAAEMLDGAIEGSRLLGTPPGLAGNLFNRSAVALAAGDVPVALAMAEEAARLADRLGEGFVAAWAAVRLAAVRCEMDEPATGADLLVERAGGEQLTLIPGGWRVHGLELLTRCLLRSGRAPEARRAAEHAELVASDFGLPLARVWAGRAVASVALHAGDGARARDLASTAARGADVVGAPIEAALSRALAGEAAAASGDIETAVSELLRAAEAFDACGAVRYRERAEQQLGKLGHRPHRRTSRGRSGALGLEALTGRELQVARLVLDRKTNPEIAAELFLSQKTIESHLRNVFNKVGVESRVALARVMEHATPDSPSASPR